jgi:hypothetical protein
VKNIPAAIADLKSLLDGFESKLSEGDLRSKVIALIPAVYALRDIGSSLVTREDASAARDRILFYLRKYPVTLIDGDELLIVSGIGEWARRRELRVQQGWWIFSGVTFRQMMADDPEQAADLQVALGVDPGKIRPDQYVLVRQEEDRDAAHRWHTLNSIRKKKIAVRDKLLEYFRANAGRPIAGEELRYLASDKNEWPRRTRELRTELGWPVVTRQQGRTDLPIGSYMLEEDKQAPEHDRKISDAVRVEVLTRDRFKCRVCDWSRDMAAKDDPRRLLELHHVHQHVKGGKNDAENLLTLCNVHHDEVHAGRVDLADYLAAPGK